MNKKKVPSLNLVMRILLIPDIRLTNTRMVFGIYDVGKKHAVHGEIIHPAAPICIVFGSIFK
jgi:hypothetical protein